jgi:hypothetical protein
MANNPTLLTQPIAANGAKNVIPNTTTTAGAMSQDQGFPAETALPLGAGGVAPSREDFNGAFNLLSGIAFMAQKGWVFLFDENQDYFAGCMVRDPLDGKIYEAINDVPASSTYPANDSTNWRIYDLSAYTKTVNSPMFNKYDFITTSGTYTAPVTGWYKITAKGGGGGGGGAYTTGGYYFSGAGGGEGGTGIGYIRMTAGDTATVTIGAGGTGGASSATGADGGNTSVVYNGTAITGRGGNGGGAGGGMGGNGGSGISILGATGGSSICIGTNNISVRGGNGGGAGGGGKNVNSGLVGGGGAGGEYLIGGTAHAGYNGGNGHVRIEYFDSTLNP